MASRISSDIDLIREDVRFTLPSELAVIATSRRQAASEPRAVGSVRLRRPAASLKVEERDLGGQDRPSGEEHRPAGRADQRGGARRGHERAPAGAARRGTGRAAHRSGFCGDRSRRLRYARLSSRTTSIRGRATRAQALATIEELRPKVEVAVKSGALALILGGDDSPSFWPRSPGCRRYYRQRQPDLRGSRCRFERAGHDAFRLSWTAW